jgi:hypothetical protein
VKRFHLWTALFPHISNPQALMCSLARCVDERDTDQNLFSETDKQMQGLVYLSGLWSSQQSGTTTTGTNPFTAQCTILVDHSPYEHNL